MSRWIIRGLALALLAFSSAAPAEDESDRRREVRIPVNPEVRLDVEIISGSIEIRGWDKPEVRIRTSGRGIDALDIESDADWVTVRGTRPGIGWLRVPIPGGDVDLKIDVPKKSDIKARTINGPIEARDVEGRVSLHAANGKIDVRGAPYEAQLETLNADIDFRGKNSRVDARTVNGSIELRGVTEEVSANTMNGSIEVRGDVIERADLRALAGSIELETALAPGARVNCKTYSGDITLEVPESTSARFDIQSFSGRIENDLGPSSISSWRGGPGQRLDFASGDGDGRVTIDTFSGSVEIRTRD